MVLKIKNYAALEAALAELTAFLMEMGVPDERVFDSKLVACELLANELKHAESETELLSELKDGHIELKILSKKGFAVPKRIVCSDVFAESGRGLFLVNELCEGQIFSEIDGIRVKIKIEK